MATFRVLDGDGHVGLDAISYCLTGGGDVRHVRVFVYYIYENGSWTGNCRELGLFVFGKSLDRARLKARQGIAAELNGLEECMARRQVFHENDVVMVESSVSLSIRPYALAMRG